MKTFEIEFKTVVRNTEHSEGNWLAYYRAESKEDALCMFVAEMIEHSVTVRKVIAVREAYK